MPTFCHSSTRVTLWVLGIAIHISSLSCVPEGFDSLKTIYGRDDRVPIDDPSVSPKVRQFSESVGMLVGGFDYSANGDGSITLSPRTLKDRMAVCPEVPFANEPAPGFCTGFLASPDLMVTAAHCLRTDVDCRNTSIVFGFYGHKEGWSSLDIPADRAFRCKSLIARKYDAATGTDYAVFRLDRPVGPDRPPLPLQRQSMIRQGAPLVMLGFPNGTPLKVATGGVLGEQTNTWFRTDLEAFIGHSGAPVVNADSMLVEGIIVRGEDDYVERGECWTLNHCDKEGPGCKGEEVLKASAFQTLVPPLGPFLQITGVQVQDLRGNRDPFADPGEKLLLSFFARNVGSSPIEAGPIGLASQHDGVSVNSTSHLMRRLQPNEGSWVRDFEVVFSENIDCRESPPLTLINPNNRWPLSTKFPFPMGREDLAFFDGITSSLAIPDGSSEGVTIPIKVTAQPDGSAVRFLLNISHGSLNHLTIKATAPDGTSAWLFYHGQSPDGRLGPLVDRINGAFGGDLQSYEDVGVFSQVKIPGTWEIKVTDHHRGVGGTVVYAGVAVVHRKCKVAKRL